MQCVIPQASAFISVLAVSQTTACKVLTASISQILQNLANHWSSTGMAVVFSAMDNGHCVSILKYAEMNHKYVSGVES